MSSKGFSFLIKFITKLLMPLLDFRKNISTALLLRSYPLLPKLFVQLHFMAYELYISVVCLMLILFIRYSICVFICREVVGDFEKLCSGCHVPLDFDRKCGVDATGIYVCKLTVLLHICCALK